MNDMGDNWLIAVCLALIVLAAGWLAVPAISDAHDRSLQESCLRHELTFEPSTGMCVKPPQAESEEK